MSADDRDLDAAVAATDALFAAAIEQNAKRTSRAPDAVTADIIPFGALSRTALDDGRTVISTMVEQAGVFTLSADSIIEDVIHAVETLDGLMAAAKLDAPRREAARVRVLQHCRASGIKDARSLVDSVLKAKSSEKTNRADGVATIALADDLPADEPVDGAALLNATSALIQRHIVLSAHQADTIALWVAAAYAIDAMSLMPILLVTAPTMRAGKTTLLTMLGAIVPRALAASNLTGAVLARAIAAFRPTLLADEADTWLTDEASELRGIMNAGHTRATAFVLRCAPDTHEPTLIPCFGARVIAMIRRPPSTVVDRAIVIELRRKRDDEQVSRFRVDRLHEEHHALRRRWRRWADDHLEHVRNGDPALPSGLHDRAADNWRPLISIADLVGSAWPDRARTAARALSGSADDADEGIAIELLRDIRMVFVDDDDVPVMKSSDLTTKLIALPERPWAEWSAGRPMTAVKLAGRLRPFGLRPRKVRQGARTVNAYERADFLDVWSRYLPAADSEHSEQSNESADESRISDSEQNGNVPSPKNEIASMNTGSVPSVPSSTRVSDPSAEKTGVRRV